MCGEERVCGDEGRVCGERRVCGDEGRVCGDEGRVRGDEGRVCGMSCTVVDVVLKLKQSTIAISLCNTCSIGNKE